MMTDEQKEAAYYKAGMLKKAPPEKRNDQTCGD